MVEARDVALLLEVVLVPPRIVLLTFVDAELLLLLLLPVTTVGSRELRDTCKAVPCPCSHQVCCFGGRFGTCHAEMDDGTQRKQKSAETTFILLVTLSLSLSLSSIDEGKSI